MIVLYACLYSYLGTDCLIGQSSQPDRIFGSALEQIQRKIRIPIVLPSKLPSSIRRQDVQLAWGRVEKDGYFISLYADENGTNASYLAGFGGSSNVMRALPNTRSVALGGGVKGMFRPVSCGGSCAPANLWWVKGGVMYQIQIVLQSSLAENAQEKILIELAQLSVLVHSE